MHALAERVVLFDGRADPGDLNGRPWARRARRSWGLDRRRAAGCLPASLENRLADAVSVPVTDGRRVGACGRQAHRYLCIIRELAACGLVALADKGYIGAGEHTCTLSTGE
jgi:hypothetical protein